jgi:predicted transcriptional regulator
MVVVKEEQSASVSSPGMGRRPAREITDRALGSLGPLEADIMGAVWGGKVPDPFVVRDVAALLPHLAYTTVMTTVARLATKGLLGVKPGRGRYGHRYGVRENPRDYVERLGRESAQDAVNRYGTAALAAFAAQLDRLTPTQRTKLEKLANEE